MTFFNKKEDVIKIELTPHGRKLLSNGKLKPTYYAFFDDDILYDSSRGGFDETNASTKSRILSETPSLKPQTSHRGIDTALKSSVSLDKNDSMVYAIGTNNFSDQDAVGWELYLLHGEADTFSYNYTTSTEENIKIPQVNCVLNYTMSVSNLSSGPFPISEDVEYGEHVLAEDGTYIKIDEKEVLIYLSEKNGFRTHDSYTIDAFIYEDNKQEYRKLKFLSRIFDDNKIENDLLKLEEMRSATGLRGEPSEFSDADTVENYFHFFVDGEVSRIKICEGIRNLKSRDIFTNIQDYDCEDLLGKEADLNINIYNSGVSEEDFDPCDEEDCE
tara:strand:+ start:348 stop:1334 length:987 start_codon:yes stop_codon:yes gene_type:complete